MLFMLYIYILYWIEKVEYTLNLNILYNNYKIKYVYNTIKSLNLQYIYIYIYIYMYMYMLYIHICSLEEWCNIIINPCITNIIN